MRLRLTTLAAIIAILSVALMGAARVVSVPCGGDLDRVVNSDPSTTATRFELGACKYEVNATAFLKNGDSIAGPTGTFTARGPAQDPNPRASIVGVGGVSNLVRGTGTVNLSWIEMSGASFDGTAGSGSAIAGGSMSDTSRVYAVEIHDNTGVGASNVHGIYDSVEVYENGSPASAGFIAGGLKAVEEMVVTRSYIHDNVRNGLWCDEECDNTGVSFGGVTGKYQVLDSVVVNNEKQGIRWEKVGVAEPDGEALIRGNRIHGNNLAGSTGGVGVRDAANAVITANTFGPATIAGVSYPANGQKVAVHVSDSGRSDRPNTEDVYVFDNTLNGETVVCKITGPCQ